MSDREELNLKVYTLHKHTQWGYKKLVRELWLSKWQVHYLVKIGDERWGDVPDAPRFERPSKDHKSKEKVGCRSSG